MFRRTYDALAHSVFTILRKQKRESDRPYHFPNVPIKILKEIPTDYVNQSDPKDYLTKYPTNHVNPFLLTSSPSARLVCEDIFVMLSKFSNPLGLAPPRSTNHFLLSRSPPCAVIDES